LGSHTILRRAPISPYRRIVSRWKHISTLTFSASIRCKASGNLWIRSRVEMERISKDRSEFATPHSGTWARSRDADFSSAVASNAAFLTRTRTALCIIRRDKKFCSFPSSTASPHDSRNLMFVQTGSDFSCPTEHNTWYQKIKYRMNTGLLIPSLQQTTR
jgi:hypothetical protein